jgi:hypothetical protein
MTHVQKETAVLLKEKGFNLKEVCDWMYIDDSEQTFEALKQPNRHEGHYSAPYYQTVLEWLREKGVHVYVQIINEGEGIFYYHPNLQDVSTGEYLESEIFDGEYTHDQALEAGIVHALKNYVK